MEAVICRKNTLYYQYCGAEISKDQVLNDLHITPPGVDIADKFYVGFFNGEEIWKKNGFTVIKEVERDGWTILAAEKKL